MVLFIFSEHSGTSSKPLMQETPMLWLTWERYMYFKVLCKHFMYLFNPYCSKLNSCVSIIVLVPSGEEEGNVNSVLTLDIEGVLSFFSVKLTT